MMSQSGSTHGLSRSELKALVYFTKKLAFITENVDDADKPVILSPVRRKNRIKRKSVNFERNVT